MCKTWQVWTVDLATGARRRIANDGMNPSWARDGSRLVYAGRLVTGFTGRGYFTYRTDLVVVELRTGRERDLGPGSWPTWAPHGERIAFLRGTRLLVGRADVRRTRTVAADVVSPAYWSPTGRQLLFTRDYGDAVITSADGRHLRRVGDFGALVAWSPDGRSIAGARFVATLDEVSAHDDLLVVPLDGTSKRIVRGAPNTRMEAPVWTRRGRIVFAAGLLEDDRDREARRAGHLPHPAQPTFRAVHCAVEVAGLGVEHRLQASHGDGHRYTEQRFAAEVGTELGNDLREPQTT